MKNILKLTLLFGFVTLFFACTKNPKASFTFNKPYYKAGDTIKLTSTSTLTNNVRWTFPYGVSSTDKEINFITDSLGDEKSLDFKLEAFTKNGGKKDELTQTVKIFQSKFGDAVFYYQADISQNFFQIQVKVNNIYFAQITKEIAVNTEPNENTNGCGYLHHLPIGEYSFTATQLLPNGSSAAAKSVSGSFIIENKKLKPFKIYFPS